MTNATAKITNKKNKRDGQDGGDSNKRKQVLKKATLKAAEFLGLNNSELSEVLKVSEASISRLRNNKDYFFDLKSNEADKALLLIRIYQSLFALIGDNSEQIKSWLKSENLYLNTSPYEAMKTTAGVVNVTEYLDAMRG